MKAQRASECDASGPSIWAKLSGGRRARNGSSKQVHAATRPPPLRRRPRTSQLSPVQRDRKTRLPPSASYAIQGLPSESHAMSMPCSRNGLIELPGIFTVEPSVDQACAVAVAVQGGDTRRVEQGRV